MFKKGILFTGLIVSVFTLGWIYHLVYLSPKDVERYEAFKRASKPQEKVSHNQTHQFRMGVRKDLWLSQTDRTRLHYRIDCQSSLLTLLPVDDKLDIIETLQELKCWMQDKLFTQGNDEVMQQIRFFKADRGTYQYSLQRFAANTVALSLFQIPGIDLPNTTEKKPFLQGIAKDVSFSLAGKATQFQAQHFKATLHKEDK